MSWLTGSHETPTLLSRRAARALRLSARLSQQVARASPSTPRGAAVEPDVYCSSATRVASARRESARPRPVRRSHPRHRSIGRPASSGTSASSAAARARTAAVDETPGDAGVGDHAAQPRARPVCARARRRIRRDRDRPGVEHAEECRHEIHAGRKHDEHASARTDAGRRPRRRSPGCGGRSPPTSATLLPLAAFEKRERRLGALCRRAVAQQVDHRAGSCESRASQLLDGCGRTARAPFSLFSTTSASFQSVVSIAGST